ncbi:MAG: hypothetical protein AAB574_02520 [Patescibacteria group bacterium]
MKQKVDKYFSKKDGEKLKNELKKDLTEVLTKNLAVVTDAKLQNEITKLKYELKDEQTKFLSEMHNIVDGLASEVRDNRDFRDITTNQIVEDRDRIGKLEKKVFGVVSLS